jgi:hypothetical protein
MSDVENAALIGHGSNVRLSASNKLTALGNLGESVNKNRA